MLTTNTNNMQTKHRSSRLWHITKPPLTKTRTDLAIPNQKAWPATPAHDLVTTQSKYQHNLTKQTDRLTALTSVCAAANSFERESSSLRSDDTSRSAEKTSLTNQI